ncbi:hypothetical protein HCU64_16810 [Methylobacterium sp. C25]|uniref:SPFH domain-containing protein n=1 Tax=Methylobacterium sp. C25 TaxID=2721622 RepID=UPI001EFF5848|nr:SPFH domain-containing protein [Methylobacterium sp. C25]MCE4225419.1 hypothetical protein [Methylobacterium sp. C25]
MSGITAVLVLGLLALAGYLTLRAIRAPSSSRTVSEWEQGLLYVDGRFTRVLGPGRYWTLGLKQQTVVVLPRQPHLDYLTNADVTSAERLSYRLSAVFTYAITDPRRAHEQGYRELMRLAVTEALVQLAAGRTLETMLAERASLGEALLPLIAQPDCGCTISGISISAITMPPELRRLYAEIERARLDGQAALERARSEQAALRSLANSARMLKGNPELMNLRLLQALSAQGGKGATLVIGREAFGLSAPGETSAEPVQES